MISTYDNQLYTSVLYQILDTTYIIGLCTKTLSLIHIGCAHGVFHDEVTFFTLAFPYVTRIGDALSRRGS